MNRAVGWSLALCLCFFAEQATAQGLLGKSSVTVQYLGLHVGDEFDDFDVDLGNGGRLQANFPLGIPNDETPWTIGIDAFGIFSGVGFDFDPNTPGLEMSATFLGGDIGAIFYTRATENIRPFVQLGLNWTNANVEASAPGFSINDNVDSGANLILHGGVEIDVFPAMSVRGSFGRGTDGLGIGTIGFLGEVIVRPGDNWFCRFSSSVDDESNVLGAIGFGYAW